MKVTVTNETHHFENVLKELRERTPVCRFFTFWKISYDDLWPQFYEKVAFLYSYDPNILKVHGFFFPTVYNLGVCSLGTLNPKILVSVYCTITRKDAIFSSHTVVNIFL